MKLLWPWYVIKLVFTFARDLTVSSFQVAKTVLAPRDTSSPRFVVVPLRYAETDLEVTMVANYITLTPGTLTVDVSPDRSTLLVHALTAEGSGDALRADIQDGIERRVTQVTRP